MRDFASSNSAICCSGATTNPQDSGRVSGHMVADRWHPAGGNWLPQDLVRDRSSGACAQGNKR